MSARGAADLLTRATKWLAITFVVLSIVMAAVAVDTTTGDGISSTLDRTVTAEPDPLAGQAGDGAAVPAEPAAAPASDDPLAGATE